MNNRVGGFIDLLLGFMTLCACFTMTSIEMNQYVMVMIFCVSLGIWFWFEIIFGTSVWMLLTIRHHMTLYIKKLLLKGCAPSLSLTFSSKTNNVLFT